MLPIVAHHPFAVVDTSAIYQLIGPKDYFGASSHVAKYELLTTLSKHLRLNSARVSELSDEALRDRKREERDVSLWLTFVPSYVALTPRPN